MERRQSACVGIADSQSNSNDWHAETTGHAQRGSFRAGVELDKQQIIAMVCSDPPEGRARWTVRLIAEEAVRTAEPVVCPGEKPVTLHDDVRPSLPAGSPNATTNTKDAEQPTSSLPWNPKPEDISA